VVRVLLQRHEAVTLVKRCSSVVLGVYEHSSPTDVVDHARTARQRISEQITTETGALAGSIKTKASEEDHRYRSLARWSGAQPSWRIYKLDCMRRNAAHERRNPRKSEGRAVCSPDGI
jgi:hypothetical protein